MKKIAIILVTLVFSIASYSQSNDGTLRFLGIRVDGTYRQVADALIAKGFQKTKSWDEEVFEGPFNGRTVRVSIQVYHGKVYRLVVDYDRGVDEVEVRKDYNELLDQFRRNAKYCEVEHNDPLPADFKEMYHIDGNRFESSFYLNPVTEGAEFRGKVWFKIALSFSFFVQIYYDNLNNLPKGEDL